MVIKPSAFDTLFKDQSLWDVFRKSFFLAENKIDVVIKLVVSIVLCTVPFTLFYAKIDLFPQAIIVLKDWASIGITYTVSILGFLIAGFTIFFTITKIEVFVGLSKLTHHKRNMSQLQFVVYSFLRVFVFHLSLLLVCIITLMSKGISTFTIIAALDPSFVIESKKIYVSLIFPILGFLVIASVLQLKTFVWNLYQSILISISSAAMMLDSKNEH